MAQSLVENLRPVSRVQPRPAEMVLRAFWSDKIQTYRGNSTVLQADMSAFASGVLWTFGDSASFVIEGSNDLNPGGNTWAPLDMWAIGRNVAPIGQGGVGGSGFFIENNGAQLFGFNRQTKHVRVRSTYIQTGRIAAMNLLLSQHTLNSPRTPVQGPEDTWAYVAAAGGITTTTAVTMQAATNAFHRTLVTRLDIANAGTTGTEVQILDGTTVIWRHWLAPGASLSRDFLNGPLRGSPSKAMTLQLSAASGATVYANAAGLTALA